MIRFSHPHNSWQVFIRRAGWIGVNATVARLFFDRGYPLIHFTKLEPEVVKAPVGRLGRVMV